MFIKRFIALYALLAVLTAGGVYFAVAASDASRTPATQHTKAISTKPVSLVGTWHQTSGMPGVKMTAEVSGDGIQVNMEMDSKDGNTHGVFWMGSFDTSDKTGGNFTVTSVPDPDAKKALRKSLFGDSAEKTKKYTYNNGDLSFEFSMMGVESTVHLSKGEK